MGLISIRAVHDACRLCLVAGTPTIALPVNATFILSIDVPTLPYEVAAFLKSYTPAASDINLINIGAGDVRHPAPRCQSWEFLFLQIACFPVGIHRCCSWACWLHMQRMMHIMHAS